MHEWFSLPYAEGRDWQAVELLYQAQEISMLLMLPAAGTFAAFRSSFTLDTLAQFDSVKADAGVVLSLPRFQFSTNLGLNRALQALGMQTAFTGACDLSGIDGNHDLSVSNVVHQALIRVDEKGTEAAAAMAVGAAVSGPGTPVVVFDARRPFLFAIRDNATKAVLFWGQVLNPLG